ncbi:hypothetical protein HPB48_022149 [Haemaphysalis longicornis]|uniref:Uncharacterized protein n=1 Tax=Haemaphysalis longicornis TaxID=44386 RepID=A0A9J6FQX2_HAELO|nr:hypothetical protein HPB48_022149 [Haemaphysalis longicornis]
MCHDYLDNFLWYDELELPPREPVYNRVNNEHFSEDDYAYAQLLFSTFKCKTLGVYSNLYTKPYCLLLSDVMENFWKCIYDPRGLDPLAFVNLHHWAGRAR